MAAIAESTLRMELAMPIAPCSRCHATVAAVWTSTTLSALWPLTGPPTALLTARPLGQQPGHSAVLLIGHSAVLLQRYILPACVVHAEVSKLAHSSPALFVSSACTKCLLILAVRHTKPSASRHGKRT